MTTKKKLTFTRGYNDSREKIEKSYMYSRSCFNCDFFYQALGDSEEVCQNCNVVEFDMVVTDNNIYCVHWSQNKRSRKDISMFKSGGRTQLD